MTKKEKKLLETRECLGAMMQLDYKAASGIELSEELTKEDRESFRDARIVISKLYHKINNEIEFNEIG